MSRSDRLSNIAHKRLRRISYRLGCVVLCSYITAAHSQTTGQSVAAEPTSRTKANQPYADDTRTPAVPKREEEKTEPYKPDCEQPQDQHAADLCVQIRAAKAAEDALGPASAQAKWAEVQTYIGGLGLAGVVASLFLSGLAAVAGIRAARAAAGANEINHQAFVASQRAWIKIDLRIDGDLVYYNDGTIVDLPVSVGITSIGSSPALRVHTNVDLVNAYETLGDYGPNRDLKAFAENCRRQITDESSRTIVPAESYVREWGATCTLRESGISPTGGDFQPVVFVCVTYETMFSKELHQTARPYYVEQSGRAFRTDDGPVAKEKLSVIVAGSGIAT